MCPECHRFLCEEGCPAFVGRARGRVGVRRLCTLCGEELEDGEKFYSIGTRPFCAACLEGADADDLQKFFHHKSREQLLSALGAVTRVAVREEECL